MVLHLVLLGITDNPHNQGECLGCLLECKTSLKVSSKWSCYNCFMSKFPNIVFKKNNLSKSVKHLFIIP